MRAVWYSLVALMVLPVAVHVGAQGIRRLKDPLSGEAAPGKPQKVKALWADAPFEGAKPPKEMVEALKVLNKAGKVVDKFDRDGDGLLDEDELPAKWRDRALRFDRDGDGKLGESELAHFLETAEREKQEQKAAKKVEAERAAEAAARAEAQPPGGGRAGRLPAGLPGWFAEVDADGDGQVGLYEWREAGGDADDFLAGDANRDGLLTPDEVLRALRYGR